MRKVLLFALLGIIFMAGTAFGASRALTDFIDNRFDFSLGKTRAEVIRTLGQPLSIKNKCTSRDFIQATRCRVYNMKYDGLELEIYEGQHCAMRQISMIVLTSPKYRVKYGLGIGTDKKNIIRLLGRPAKIQKNSLLYCYPNGLEFCVPSATIYFRNNRVSHIEWVNVHEGCE
jgi:hypothetical protein